MPVYQFLKMAFFQKRILKGVFQGIVYPLAASAEWIFSVMKYYELKYIKKESPAGHKTKAYAYQNRVVGAAASVIDFFGRIIFCGIRRGGPIEKKGVRRILVIKLDHLGDCFLMTPLLENLQKIFQGVVVDVLCQEAAGPLFRGNPFIREIITFNYRRTHRGTHPKGFGRLMISSCRVATTTTW